MVNRSVAAQEYEKRLLAKDHDLKCSQAQLEHVRVELAEAKRIQAEGSHLLPAPEAHEGACPAALSCMPCPAPCDCPAWPLIPCPALLTLPCPVPDACKSAYLGMPCSDKLCTALQSHKCQPSP